MAELNIPFRLLLADRRTARQVDRRILAQLEAIVVPPGDQRPTLPGEGESKTVFWPDKARLDALAPARIELLDADNLTLALHRRRAPSKTVGICHLVNRDYRSNEDAIAPRTNCVLRMRNALFNAAIARATLFAPQAEAIELAVQTSRTASAIAIPEIRHWAVVRLEPKT